MFTLDRPTCARSRLSAFQVVQGFSASAGRCSSALMKVHTGVQGLESFSPQLHASSFRCCVNGFSAFEEALPRFQAWHHSEMSIDWVLWSVACRVRSVQLVTALLMPDGPIPAGTGRLLVFVGLRQPVIIRQVSFSVASSFFAWVERSHTE